LLARPDQVRITSPIVSRETTEKVLATLRAEVGDKVRLDNPTQNLESYFLDVVERARAQAKTSGATSGNQVAQFIRGGSAEAASNQTDAVLDRLTRPTTAASSTEPVVATPTPTAAVDQSRLAALTKAAEPTPAPTAPASADPTAPPQPGPTAPAQPKAPVDLSKANDKLSGLLGGRK
jgi:ABC-2 type transport system ATP-binding protein